MIFSLWIILLAGIDASSVMRSMFKSLKNLDDSGDVFDESTLNFKSFLALKLDQLLPINENGRAFLPEKPSNFLLASLLDAVKRNDVDFDIITYSSQLLLNPANISALMVECFENIKVIKNVWLEFERFDEADDPYEQVKDCVLPLLTTYDAFIQKILLEIKTSNLVKVKNLHESVFKPENVEATFYLIRNIPLSELSQSFVDFFFALAKTSDDTEMLWDTYFRNISTELCLPLPLYYLQARQKGMSSVFDRLKSLFTDTDMAMTPAWLGQFSELMVFRLLTREQALEFAQILNPFLLKSAAAIVEDENYLNRFATAIFCNFGTVYGGESSFMAGDQTILRFNGAEEKREFLIELWNHTIGCFEKLPETAISEIMPDVMKLEVDFPGILKQLKIPFLDTEFPEDDISIMNQMSSFISPNEPEKDIEAYEGFLNIVLLNSKLDSLTELRSKTAAIASFLDQIVTRIVERQYLQTQEIITIVGNICGEITERSELACQFESSEFLENWITFVFFYLSDDESIQAAMKIILKRLAPSLHSAFYQTVLKCNLAKPEMLVFSSVILVPMGKDRSEASQFVSSILKIQTDRQSISPKMIDFVHMCYKMQILSLEDTLGFISYLHQFDPIVVLEWPEFAEFVSGITTWRIEFKTGSGYLPELDISGLLNQVTAINFGLFGYFSAHCDSMTDFMTRKDHPFLLWFFENGFNMNSFTFPVASSDQLEPYTGSLTFATVNEGISFFLKRILQLLRTGATRNDLKQLLNLCHDMILAPRESQNGTKDIFLAALYLIQVMILRFDSTIMSKADIDEIFLVSFRLARISLYPIGSVYAALPENLQIELFSKYTAIHFHHSNVWQVFDLKDFIQLPAKTRQKEIKALFKFFKLNGHLEPNVAELACFLLKHDVLEDSLIKMVIKLISESPDIDGFSSFCALRIIFSKPSLQEYRKEAVEKLIQPRHYGFSNLSQIPTFAPNISFFSDFYEDPEFVKWLNALPENHAQSIRSVVAYDKDNVKSASLNVEDGFERIVQVYRKYIVDLYNFEMSMSTKICLFSLVFHNLDVFSRHFSSAGLVFDEYTSSCPEAFVQASVSLVYLLVNDKTSVHTSLNVGKSQFENLATAVDMFVRNSEIQSFLYRCLFSSVKDVDVKNHILTVLPRFFNVSRCPLDAQSFCLLANTSTRLNTFQSFLTEIIENSFSAIPSVNQAIDINASPVKKELVSSRFFKFFKDLVVQCSLPDMYVILILKNMVENSDLVDVRDENVFAFLNESLSSRSSGINSAALVSKFGPEMNVIGSVNPEVLQLIIDFILLRNDAVGCALDYGTFFAMRDLSEKLMKLAPKKIEKSSVLKLITSIMRSNDINGANESLGKDLPKWHENAILHFFAFSTRLLTVETSMVYFSLVPSEIEFEELTHIEHCDSWFSAISKLYDQIVKAENSIIVSLLTEQIIEKFVYYLPLMLPDKIAALWKVMQALKSCKPDLQTRFIKTIIELDILSFINDDLSRFFYELRQWALFKKKLGGDLLWQLVQTEEEEEEVKVAPTVTPSFDELTRRLEDLSLGLATASKEDTVQAVNSVLQTLQRRHRLPRSQELCTAICNFVSLVEQFIPVFMEASEVFLWLKALFETVPLDRDIEEFNNSVSVLCSLLTMPKSQEDFFNLVLLPSVLLDNRLLPESLPNYFLNDAADFVLNFFSEFLKRSSKMNAKTVHIILQYMLNCENVPDSLFVQLSLLLANLSPSDITERLVSLLKELFTVKKHLIKFYGLRLLTEALLVDSYSFKLLLPLLKIIYQHDQSTYKASCETLNTSIKSKLDLNVGSEVIERKRKLVFDLASRTISSTELTKFEKFDISILNEEQKQSLVPLLNEATRKLISSEAVISLADFSKVCPFNNSDVNATLKMIMPEVLIASYTKLSAKMPVDILKLCCEREFILDESSLAHLIDLMETESFVRKTEFLVACLKKVNSPELMIKRLWSLLPIDSFIEALDMQGISFSAPLFAHLLENPEIENLIRFAKYLSGTQFEFLTLLRHQ